MWGWEEKGDCCWSKGGGGTAKRSEEETISRLRGAVGAQTAPNFRAKSENKYFSELGCYSIREMDTAGK